MSPLRDAASVTEVTAASDSLQGHLVSAGLGTLTRGAHWEAMRAAGAVKDFRAGQVLWRSGGESLGLYVVLSGRVRVVRSRGGRQHLIHVAGPGATMGEVPIFDQGPYPATAIAAERSRCWVVAPSTLRDVASRSPEVAAVFLDRLARRVRLLVERLHDQTVGGVRGRIAASLIGLRIQQGKAEVVLPSPQGVWAEDLGTVREVLSRELTRLAKSGTIERVGRGRVRLADEVQLERLATGVGSV